MRKQQLFPRKIQRIICHEASRFYSNPPHEILYRQNFQVDDWWYSLFYYWYYFYCVQSLQSCILFVNIAPTKCRHDSSLLEYVRIWSKTAYWSDTFFRNECPSKAFAYFTYSRLMFVANYIWKCEKLRSTAFNIVQTECLYLKLGSADFTFVWNVLIVLNEGRCSLQLFCSVFCSFHMSIHLFVSVLKGTL